MNRFAPRIHVLLARDAPVGLVIRRGPSKCVATLLWDRRTDEFQLGQWLKGRIYEDRCDLSPDGKHFLYFATKKANYYWTAISRAPYLKALVLLRQLDSYYGGGLWTGRKSFWSSTGPLILQNYTNADFRIDPNYQPVECFGCRYPPVYYTRLVRDGWSFRQNVREFVHEPAFAAVGKMKKVLIFEKPIPGGWILRKIVNAEMKGPPGKGYNWDEHELVNPANNSTIACPQWQWADLDGKRLVWAAEGKLFGGRLTGDDLVDETKLFDFSEMTFSPIEAPY